MTLTKEERAKLEALRATRPNDEVLGVFWLDGEPINVVWASDPVDHMQYFTTEV